jgi:site-specific DNA recombinase
MEAIGYVRVSTTEQATEGISLAMQAAKIRAYAELNDMELIGIVEDAGYSAKSISGRPGVQSILEMVRTKAVGAVIVYKLDRLARNTIESLEMAQTMDKAGVALHSITEKLDTQSALGRFFFTLTASLAEMERGLIAERTAAALAQKKARGEKTGGTCPYGFTVDDRGKLIPVPGEQKVLSRVRELRADGFTYRGIIEALKVEGFMSRNGRAFQLTQITRMLKVAA